MQENQNKQEKREISEFDKIFIAELIQDIPIWFTILMGIYKNLQNEYLYYSSFIVGTVASLYILKKIKEGVYRPGILSENPNEGFAFTIYSFALLAVLLIGDWKNLLYKESYAWIYLICFSALELIFYLKYTKQEE